MKVVFFKGVPDYYMRGFCAVRDVFDNLSNLLNLAEIVNTCTHCIATEHVEDFDVVVFSGSFSRALIKKDGGFFSMSIPFQIVNHGDRVSFNFDFAKEEVSGLFISIIRNALLTSKDGMFSHDDVVCSISDAFGLDVADAIRYFDAFIALLADDHGYFRFDDDPDHENGDFHPRYHFDFFYKNTSSVKIGVKHEVDINCFYALFDKAFPKWYLRK